DSFPQLLALLDQAKEKAQAENQDGNWVQVAYNVPLFVERGGFTRGGGRGTHYEFRIRFQGIQLGLSREREANSRRPNLVVRLSGRECLLFGAARIYYRVRDLVQLLGGFIFGEKLTRVDMCLDVANLPTPILQNLVERGC